MKNIIKLFFCILFSLVLCSCGADALKIKSKTDQQALSSECSFDSSYSPVCSNGIDYENISQAHCRGASNIKAGHCDCSKNNIPVCGTNGQEYSECDANTNHITIAKFVPCAAREN